MAAIALAVGLGVSGCTSDSPTPTPLGTPTASTSVTSTPSATPTPTAPELPAAAKGTSAASAKAFVKYWAASLNFAGTSGDVSRLNTISDKDCTSCQAVITSIRKVYSDGGYFKGNGWTVSTLDVAPLQPKMRPVITAGVTIAPQVLVEASGVKPRRFKGGRRSMIFHLASVDGGWTLLQLDQPT